MLKKVKKIFFPISLILILFTTLSAGYLWWNSASRAPKTDPGSLRFVVAKGAGASQIAYNLERAGVIKSAFAFKVYVQIRGVSEKILAGEYTVSQNKNLSEIVGILLKGPSELWVTIPEGLRKEEIAHKIAAGLGLEGEEYTNFVSNFVALTGDKEGYLFPDTYLFPKDITADKVVLKMTEVFDTRFEKALENKNVSLDTSQIVILASIIEREALTDSERPVIAGILLNRLEADWPLQVDASVQYGITNSKLRNRDTKLDDYWPILTKQDLDVDTPYNTYKYQGFPATPISNPGVSSLSAAANPSQTNYWFYLHDTGGVIHYAKTIEEHNENIRKYLGK